MSSFAPTLLNKHFKVLSYNGGIGKDNVEVIFDLDAGQDYFSKSGSGFDMLLEYTGPEDVFTLSHITASAVASGTAPLKTLGVWVHPAGAVPDISYGSRFQMDEAVFLSNQGAMRPSPNPTAFFACKRRGITAHVVEAPVSGKYLHLRFVNAYAGNNIDIGQIGLVGAAGAKAPAADMTVAAPAAAAGGIAKLNWGTMFNATTKRPDAAPEVYQQLTLAGAIRTMSPDYRTVNPAYHVIFASARVHAYILYSKVNVAAAVAAAKDKTATPDQALVADYYNALTAAVRSAPNKPRKLALFFDETSAHSADVARSGHAKATVDPKTNLVSYEFPQGVDGPVMLVAVTTEGTAAAFQDQDKEALRAGLPTGKDKESLEEALKSLSLSGSSFADSVAGFVLAKHDALMPFAPSAPAPANDAHPTVDNVKVATASTFQRVVIDSANPVIVVIDVEDHAPLNKLAFVMAQMFARNNIAVDVVTYDPALNKVDDDLINTGDFAPMYVFVKQTAAEAEAAKAKAAAETAAAAADKKGKKISFDIPAEKLAQPSNVSVKNAAGLTVRAFTLDLSSTAKSGKKAAAEGADEDEDEDEDEQEQDEEGEQRMPLPTCANLLKFLTEAGVAVTESEDVTKDCKVIEDYFKVGSQMAEALRSMLNMARVLPNQKYSFAAGSAQATALLQLVTFITFLEEKDVLKGASDSAELWSNVVVIASQAPEVLSNALPTVRMAITVLEKTRMMVYMTGKTLALQRTRLAAELVSEAEDFSARVTAIVGPYLPESLSDADREAAIAKEATEMASPINMEAFMTLIKEFGAFFNTRYFKALEDLDAGFRKASGYDDVVKTLTDVQQFMRVSAGLPPTPVVAKVKPGVKAKPKAEQPVENASERLIVVHVTHPGLVSMEDYAKLAGTVRGWNGEADPANIIMVRTQGCDVFEQISDQLAVSLENQPAALYFNNDALVEGGIQTQADAQAIRDFVELMTSATEFGENPSGMGEEMEGDEGFGGMFGEGDDEEDQE